jgi:hypothetical protein
MRRKRIKEKEKKTLRWANSRRAHPIRPSVRPKWETARTRYVYGAWPRCFGDSLQLTGGSGTQTHTTVILSTPRVAPSRSLECGTPLSSPTSAPLNKETTSCGEHCNNHPSLGTIHSTTPDPARPCQS